LPGRPARGDYAAIQDIPALKSVLELLENSHHRDHGATVALNLVSDFARHGFNDDSAEYSFKTISARFLAGLPGKFP
jgi:hypothetical protein